MVELTNELILRTNMSEKILKLFIEKGFLLDKEMLEFFSQLADEDVANEILNKIQLISEEKVITKTLMDNNFNEIKPVFDGLDVLKKKIIERFFVNVSVSVEVKKETSIEEKKQKEGQKGAFLSSVKIVSSPIIKDKKLEVKYFTRNFRNKYNFFKNLLKDRAEL